MTWKPAPVVTGGQNVVAKYLRISRLFKQRGESGAVLSPPGAAQTTAAAPSAGETEAQGRDTRMPRSGRVSSEDLPAWGQDEKQARGGVTPEPRQGGSRSSSITKGRRQGSPYHPPEYSKDMVRP